MARWFRSSALEADRQAADLNRPMQWSALEMNVESDRIGSWQLLSVSWRLFGRVVRAISMIDWAHHLSVESNLGRTLPIGRSQTNNEANQPDQNCNVRNPLLGRFRNVAELQYHPPKIDAAVDAQVT